MPPREEILILYGSQTGNSASAAQNLTALISKKIPTLRTRLMECDEFIYSRHGKWTRFVIIITSSYGVGQAPMGCHRFREFCDFIFSPARDDFLKPVTYMLLGLGDSQYRTFFKNPTRIDEALNLAGARRVGTLGKADASGVGEEEQEKVVERWIADVFPVLEKFMAEGRRNVEEEEKDLDFARKRTLEICTGIFPDYPPAKEKRSNVGFMVAIVVILIGVQLARVGALSEAMDAYWRWYDGETPLFVK